ncbi:hypothetical protein [Paraburkholderia youngii]|uniref:hypothetical protein n=1 Tax=Paraburkholderia youngii TaxID=2782701 RepID=UPI003D1F1481
MKDLLTFAIEAHGGLKRWNELSEVSADLEVGGVLWGLKGQQGFIGPSHVATSLHYQRASHSPFLDPAHRTAFNAEHVAIETQDGLLVEDRENTRRSFAGHTLETPWDRIQLAYFAGYAMWKYLTSPFSLITEGFESAEVEPWHKIAKHGERFELAFRNRFDGESHHRDLFETSSDVIFRSGRCMCKSCRRRLGMRQSKRPYVIRQCMVKWPRILLHRFT